VIYNRLRAVRWIDDKHMTLSKNFSDSSRFPRAREPKRRCHALNALTVMSGSVTFDRHGGFAHQLASTSDAIRRSFCAAGKAEAMDQ
jgi:hypothetical protein